MDMVTLLIHKTLVRRLVTLARGMGLSPTALANPWLEAAVNEEERRLVRDRQVARELDAVLVRAIRRREYDGQAGAPRGRTPPPP
jgi:hypothetical protein